MGTTELGGGGAMTGKGTVDTEFCIWTGGGGGGGGGSGGGGGGGGEEIPEAMEGDGSDVVITNFLGTQLKGTYEAGSCRVGRRGTIEPFASTNRVLPVVWS